MAHKKVKQYSGGKVIREWIVPEHDDIDYLGGGVIRFRNAKQEFVIISGTWIVDTFSPQLSGNNPSILSPKLGTE